MKRGDIYHVDLNPTAGREQAGARFVLIVSPAEFNALGTPLVCQLPKVAISHVMPASRFR
ncbi:MAG TPA: type II toxin-antitoxin system PemK/MazF family toxin [Bryobacteraceae bacterium]|nr:type II toxin-antitoxin system PemK/MazF family toxin [Bryobacteraceae bacterium]